MSSNPTFSRIYPLEGEGGLKGYNYGVKILDYKKMNKRLDSQQELRSLTKAEEIQHKQKENRGFSLTQGRYKIEEVETDEYPTRTWKVLVKYYVPEPPYYASAEAHAFYWGVISQYTEPFYVYCSPKDHTMPTVADVFNEKSPHHDENYCYRITANEGNVSITKQSVCPFEETVMVDDFSVEEDDVDEW